MTPANAIYSIVACMAAGAVLAWRADWVGIIRPLMRRRDFLWRLAFQKDRVNDEFRATIATLTAERDEVVAELLDWRRMHQIEQSAAIDAKADRDHWHVEAATLTTQRDTALAEAAVWRDQAERSALSMASAHAEMERLVLRHDQDAAGWQRAFASLHAELAEAKRLKSRPKRVGGKRGEGAAG